MLKSLALACVVGGVTVMAFPVRDGGDDSVESVAIPPPPQQTVVDLGRLAGGGQKFRLAVPEFTTATADPELQEIAKTLSAVLWADLEFESEFFLIDRKLTAGIPVATSMDTVAHDKWKEAGADGIIVGSVARTAAGLQVDVRLAGISGSYAKQQLFGEQYTDGGCAVKTVRFCAHYIADDLHKKRASLDGVARTKFVFTSDRDNAAVSGRVSQQSIGKELYIADYDGFGQTRITYNKSLNLAGAWSPDALSVVYTSPTLNFMEIFVHNISDARAPSRPARGGPEAHNQFAEWSPDGTKLAFASNRSGDWDIWVMNRDGSGMQNITRWPRATDNAPTWSPTGTMIAFASNRSGSNQIFMISADGTGAAERLTFEGEADAPAWSPVQNEIAYTFQAPGGAGHEINLVDAATKKIITLTDGIGDYESPTFAFNGRHIGFTASRWGKKAIGTVDRSGKNIRCLIGCPGGGNSGNNGYANWSRTPGSAVKPATGGAS